MGTKGAKRGQAAAEASEWLVGKLRVIGGVTAKAMFGGYGIFHDGKMFAIVDSAGTCFLKADAEFQKSFEDAGSMKHDRMPYFSIPDDLLDDSAKLVEWAKRSIQVSKA